MTPADAEALFTEIEYAVLRKAAGYDRGELAACKGKFLWLTRLASIPPNTPVEAGKVGVAAGVKEADRG